MHYTTWVDNICAIRYYLLLKKITFFTFCCLLYTINWFYTLKKIPRYRCPSSLILISSLIQCRCFVYNTHRRFDCLLPAHYADYLHPCTSAFLLSCCLYNEGLFSEGTIFTQLSAIHKLCNSLIPNNFTQFAFFFTCNIYDFDFDHFHNSDHWNNPFINVNCTNTVSRKSLLYDSIDN